MYRKDKRMIPLYILGLLLRFGPQHGYQIRKLILDQLSDFTQIKLPTIYYHLERMEADGYLVASREKPGSRPEKTVYTVTEKGIHEFKNLLDQLLDFEYRPLFASDGAFFFSDHLDEEKLTSSLHAYEARLRQSMENIEKHKIETLRFLPDEMKTSAMIIFNHHQLHYDAELRWINETLRLIGHTVRG
jgi:DNA-binding PadR family transcriptional regulator